TVLRLGSLLFRLHPGALLITLLAIAILVKLGFWQIDRGQEKQRIIDRHEHAAVYTDLSPATFAELADAADSEIEFQGQIQTFPLFLVDNQIQQGRTGYHVLALVRPNQVNNWLVPVNFGWVPADFDRSVLPDIELPASDIKVQGRIRVPAARPFMLQEQDFSGLEGANVHRIQYPELDKLSDALSSILSESLAQFIVLQDPQAELGYVREWPVVVMPPHRHYAYAMQWFGLALAALIVFVFASRERSGTPPNNKKNKETP
ncbi:MAG: SURF1 family protein, partial [Firmicutes bacterium]|nr:SURF1 family protein [Bacillota bacterium]